MHGYQALIGTYAYIKNSRVCSVHFVSGKPAGLYDEANPDWVPSRNMGYTVFCPPDEDRHTRLIRRKRQREEQEDTSQHETGAACQTDEVMPLSNEELASAEELRKLKEEIVLLKEDNQRLTAKLLSQQSVPDSERILNIIQKKDEKLKFYTGINEWCVFKALYDMVASSLPDSPKLSKMNMFLMFFLKIRLNLFDEDIGDRFGVHRSTVSRNFHRVLDIMFVKTRHLIMWPERETLRLTMPMSFRKFFKQCAVIVDCSEVFIERPSNLLAIME